jgi:hypothetical protein
MLNVEARLAEWRSLYAALGAAELRLQEARAAGRHDAAAVRLELEVRRLRAEGELALRAVDAALAETHSVHEHA